MTSIPCTACAAPVESGRTLCRAHIEELITLVHRLPAVLSDLDVTISRQARLTERQRRAGSYQPLPFAVRAAQVHVSLSVAVAQWAGMFGVARHGWAQARAGAPRACARYLADALPLIVRHTDSGAILRDLDRLVSAALREIDRPPDMIYVGVCSANGCETDVYAPPDAAAVRCPRCHVQHNVQERRAVLLAAVEDQLATATEISRAVATYGAPGEYLTAERIRKWRERGRIVVRSVTVRGDPRYRVGDVLDLLRRHARHREH